MLRDWVEGGRTSAGCINLKLGSFLGDPSTCGFPQKDCIPSINKQTWFLTTCWPIEFEVVRGGKLKARKGVNVSWLEVEWMWRWGLLIGSDFGLPEAFQVLDFMLLCCRTLSLFLHYKCTFMEGGERCNVLVRHNETWYDMVNLHGRIFMLAHAANCL